MVTKTQTLPESAGFLINEALGVEGRKSMTVVSGQDLKAGSVITGIGGTVATAAGAGNTGDGVFAATPVGLAGVKEGDYELVIIETEAALGTFALYGPDGSVVDTGKVGTAFSKELSFTLNDGGTDFVAGDRFTIKVVSPKWMERATTIPARGVLLSDVDASAADKSGVAVLRSTIINKLELVHFSGATTADKDAAIADLLKVGVIAN